MLEGYYCLCGLRVEAVRLSEGAPFESGQRQSQEIGVNTIQSSLEFPYGGVNTAETENRAPGRRSGGFGSFGLLTPPSSQQRTEHESVGQQNAGCIRQAAGKTIAQ